MKKLLVILLLAGAVAVGVTQYQKFASEHEASIAKENDGNKKSRPALEERYGFTSEQAGP